MLVPITLFVSTAVMILGIVYFNTRENLAMIEKGMNPKDKIQKPMPFLSLKFGLLLLGAGSGLLAAYLFDRLVMHDDTPAIYFALIAIGGGLGLLGSYKTERAWYERQEEKLAQQG